MASGLHLYEVNINGIPHTMQLDAEAAERYGEAATRKAPKPSHDDDQAEKARTTPTNKRATPANK